MEVVELASDIAEMLFIDGCLVVVATLGWTVLVKLDSEFTVLRLKFLTPLLTRSNCLGRLARLTN